VAVLAHWSTDAEPSRSVVTMLQELAAGGFETVLVSAADAVGPLSRVCTWVPDAPCLPVATMVLRRANVGYDFGSWAAVLSAFPGVRRARRVLLVNDSLIGPFSSLAPILADFEAGPTPVWGLSGSLQHRPHMQSFFMGYRDGVLDSAPLRAFWTDIRVESRKAKTVRYDELGLSEALDEARIAWRTMFEPVPGGPQNPTIEDWPGMLRAGFPFVKSEALVAPTTWVAEAEGLASALRRELGEDPAAWLPDGTVVGRDPARVALGQRVRTITDIGGVSGLGTATGARIRRAWRRGRTSSGRGRRAPGR
jgi:hypothetical protein